MLLHLLTRKRGENGERIGSTAEEIVKALDFGEKNQFFQFNRIIINFSQYIQPLGLSLRFNPMNAHWYLIQDKETVEYFKENPLFSTPRLAATLLVILLLNVLNKQTTIAQVANYRNVKNIKQDLKSLKEMGYIDYNDTHIQLTEKLVYNVDIQRLIEKIEHEQMVQTYIERCEAKNNSPDNQPVNTKSNEKIARQTQDLEEETEIQVKSAQISTTEQENNKRMDKFYENVGEEDPQKAKEKENHNKEDLKPIEKEIGITETIEEIDEILDLEEEK